MNVKTNVQAGQDLRFAVMDETSGTVTPIDVQAVRWHPHLTTVEKMQCCEPDEVLITAADQTAINWMAKTVDDLCSEIERLRETVAMHVRAMRLNADPKGKWFKSCQH